MKVFKLDKLVDLIDKKANKQEKKEKKAKEKEETAMLFKELEKIGEEKLRKSKKSLINIENKSEIDEDNTISETKTSRKVKLIINKSSNKSIILDSYSKPKASCINFTFNDKNFLSNSDKKVKSTGKLIFLPGYSKSLGNVRDENKRQKSSGNLRILRRVNNSTAISNKDLINAAAKANFIDKEEYKKQILLDSLYSKFDSDLMRLKKGGLNNSNYQDTKLMCVIEDLYKNPQDYSDDVRSAYLQIFLNCFQSSKRSEEEVNLIYAFLKRIPNFIQKLNLNPADIHSFLTYLSKKLDYKYMPKENVLFRTGDNADRIYINLNGKVDVVISKMKKVVMNEIEYFQYLMRLYKNNDENLLSKVFDMNKNIFNGYSMKTVDFIANSYVNLLKNKKIELHKKEKENFINTNSKNMKISDLKEIKEESNNDYLINNKNKAKNSSNINDENNTIQANEAINTNEKFNRASLLRNTVFGKIKDWESSNSLLNSNKALNFQGKSNNYKAIDNTISQRKSFQTINYKNSPNKLNQSNLLSLSNMNNNINIISNKNTNSFYSCVTNRSINNSNNYLLQKQRSESDCNYSNIKLLHNLELHEKHSNSLSIRNSLGLNRARKSTVQVDSSKLKLLKEQILTANYNNIDAYSSITDIANPFTVNSSRKSKKLLEMKSIDEKDEKLINRSLVNIKRSNNTRHKTVINSDKYKSGLHRSSFAGINNLNNKDKRKFSIISKPNMFGMLKRSNTILNKNSTNNNRNKDRNNKLNLSSIETKSNKNSSKTELYNSITTPKTKSILKNSSVKKKTVYEKEDLNKKNSNLITSNDQNLKRYKSHDYDDYKNIRNKSQNNEHNFTSGNTNKTSSNEILSSYSLRKFSENKDISQANLNINLGSILNYNDDKSVYMGLKNNDIIDNYDNEITNNALKNSKSSFSKTKKNHNSNIDVNMSIKNKNAYKEDFLNNINSKSISHEKDNDNMKEKSSFNMKNKVKHISNYSENRLTININNNYAIREIKESNKKESNNNLSFSSSEIPEIKKEELISEKDSNINSSENNDKDSFSLGKVIENKELCENENDIENKNDNICFVDNSENNNSNASLSKFSNIKKKSSTRLSLKKHINDEVLSKNLFKKEIKEENESNEECSNNNIDNIINISETELNMDIDNKRVIKSSNIKSFNELNAKIKLLKISKSNNTNKTNSSNNNDTSSADEMKSILNNKEKINLEQIEENLTNEELTSFLITLKNEMFNKEEKQSKQILNNSPIREKNNSNIFDVQSKIKQSLRSFLFKRTLLSNNSIPTDKYISSINNFIDTIDKRRLEEKEQEKKETANLLKQSKKTIFGNVSSDRFINSNIRNNNINNNSKKSLIKLTSNINLNENIRELKEVTVFFNIFIRTMGDGEIFGSLGLEAKDQKRSAAIITNSDCHFATLETDFYRRGLKAVLDKAMKNDMTFLNNLFLFDYLTLNQFKSQFFHLFVFNNYIKGQSVFRSGEVCESLYIVNQGEYELRLHCTLKDLINLIINYINKIKDTTSFYPRILEEVNLNDENLNINYLAKELQQVKWLEDSKIMKDVEKTSRVLIIKNQELIGLNEIFNNKTNNFLYSLNCISTTGRIFYIGNRDFTEVVKKKARSQNANLDYKIAMFSIQKYMLLIDRLQTIKSTLIQINSNKNNLDSEIIQSSMKFDTSISVKNNYKNFGVKKIDTGAWSTYSKSKNSNIYNAGNIQTKSFMSIKNDSNVNHRSNSKVNRFLNNSEFKTKLESIHNVDSKMNQYGVRSNVKKKSTNHLSYRIRSIVTEETKSYLDKSNISKYQTENNQIQNNNENSENKYYIEKEFEAFNKYNKGKAYDNSLKTNNKNINILGNDINNDKRLVYYKKPSISNDFEVDWLNINNATSCDNNINNTQIITKKNYEKNNNKINAYSSNNNINMKTKLNKLNKDKIKKSILKKSEKHSDDNDFDNDVNIKTVNIESEYNKYNKFSKSAYNNISNISKISKTVSNKVILIENINNENSDENLSSYILNDGDIRYNNIKKLDLNKKESGNSNSNAAHDCTISKAKKSYKKVLSKEELTLQYFKDNLINYNGYYNMPDYLQELDKESIKTLNINKSNAKNNQNHKTFYKMNTSKSTKSVKSLKSIKTIKTMRTITIYKNSNEEEMKNIINDMGKSNKANKMSNFKQNINNNKNMNSKNKDSLVSYQNNDTLNHREKDNDTSGDDSKINKIDKEYYLNEKDKNINEHYHLSIKNTQIMDEINNSSEKYLNISHTNVDNNELSINRSHTSYRNKEVKEGKEEKEIKDISFDRLKSLDILNSYIETEDYNRMPSARKNNCEISTDNSFSPNKENYNNNNNEVINLTSCGHYLAKEKRILSNNDNIENITIDTNNNKSKLKNFIDNIYNDKISLILKDNILKSNIKSIINSSDQGKKKKCQYNTNSNYKDKYDKCVLKDKDAAPKQKEFKSINNNNNNSNFKVKSFNFNKLSKNNKEDCLNNADYKNDNLRINLFLPQINNNYMNKTKNNFKGVYKASSMNYNFNPNKNNDILLNNNDKDYFNNDDVNNRNSLVREEVTDRSSQTNILDFNDKADVNNNCNGNKEIIRYQLNSELVHFNKNNQNHNTAITNKPNNTNIGIDEYTITLINNFNNSSKSFKPNKYSLSTIENIYNSNVNSNKDKRLNIKNDLINTVNGNHNYNSINYNIPSNRSINNDFTNKLLTDHELKVKKNKKNDNKLFHSPDNVYYTSTTNFNSINSNITKYNTKHSKNKNQNSITHNINTNSNNIFNNYNSTISSFANNYNNKECLNNLKLTMSSIPKYQVRLSTISKSNNNTETKYTNTNTNISTDTNINNCFKGKIKYIIKDKQIVQVNEEDYKNKKKNEGKLLIRKNLSHLSQKYKSMTQYDIQQELLKHRNSITKNKNNEKMHNQISNDTSFDSNRNNYYNTLNSNQINIKKINTGNIGNMNTVNTDNKIKQLFTQISSQNINGKVRVTSSNFNERNENFENRENEDIDDYNSYVSGMTECKNNKDNNNNNAKEETIDSSVIYKTKTNGNVSIIPNKIYSDKNTKANFEGNNSKNSIYDNKTINIIMNTNNTNNKGNKSNNKSIKESLNTTTNKNIENKDKKIYICNNLNKDNSNINNKSINNSKYSSYRNTSYNAFLLNNEKYSIKIPRTNKLSFSIYKRK